MGKRDAIDTEAYRQTLIEWLPRGSKIHLLSTKTSADGITHYVAVMAIVHHIGATSPTVTLISYRVAKVLGLRATRDGSAVIIRAGGVDVGAWLAYRLGNALFDPLPTAPESITHHWL